MSVDKQIGLIIDRDKILSNALWTFFGQAIPSLVILIILPAFIHSLGYERFGAFTISLVFFVYLNLLDLGVGVGLTRFLSASIARGNHVESCELINTALTMLLILGCGGSFILYFFLPLVLSLLNIPSFLAKEMHGALCIFLITAPLALYSGAFRSILNANQRMDLVNFIDILLSLIRALGMLFISIYTNDIRFLAAFFGLTQLGALVFYYSKATLFFPYGNLRKSFNIQKVKLFLSFGGWLTVPNVLGPVMLFIDRLILGVFLSISVLPFYTVPYDLASKLLVIPAAIYFPFFPVFSALNSVDISTSIKIFMRSVRFLLIFIFPIILTAFIFAREGLSLWMGVDFANKSHIILQWLLAGVLINSLALLAVYYLLAFGKTKLLAVFYLLEFAIYLPLLFVLIRKFGLIGAAIAWVVRVIIDAFLMYAAFIKLTNLDSKNARELVFYPLLALLLLVFAPSSSTYSIKVIYSLGAGTFFSLSLWRFVMGPEDHSWVSGMVPCRFK